MNAYGRVMNAFLKANDPPVEMTIQTTDKLPAENTEVALQRIIEELEAHSDGEINR
jgi:hypothetical protein